MKKIENILKRKYNKTEAFGLLMILFALGTFIDVLIGNWSLFSVIFSLILIFLGRKKRQKGKLFFGNLLIATGGLTLIGGLLTTFAFYFVMVSISIYYGYHLFKGAANPQKVSPTIEPEIIEAEKREFVKVEPFFKNMLVGDLRQMDESFALEDINIQYGFGDIHLDLSYTMIPEGETVILIRGMVGNIRLDIPYDIEMSIQTSVLVGKINVLEERQNSFNITQKYQTKDYKESTRKVKIIISLLAGDIEVKNL